MKRLWTAKCVLAFSVLAIDARQVLEQSANGIAAAASSASSRIASGSYDPVDLEVVAKQHSTDLVPLLERRFSEAKRPELKLKIANVLLRLGEKDDAYWRYMEREALDVISRDIPDALDYDETGKSVGVASDTLERFAKEHHQSAKAVALRAMRDDPGVILELATSNDARAIPVLRRALQARNSLVRVMAAQGLAALRDNDSVGAIIHACNESPREAAASIAQSLAYFKDEDAQKVVDKLVPEKIAIGLRQRHQEGHGPFD